MGGLSAAAPPAAADASRAVPRDWLLTPSLPWRLGAHCVDGGVHFAVFSAHASRVDLCVFDEQGHTELARLPLPGHEHDIWHGHLAGAGPGLVYGFRAHGPWRPERGHRFNPHKLLLDPWAREIVGHFNWGGEHFGADPRHPSHQDQRDNAATALKARVVADSFDWQGDRHPRRAFADTVIYELHVKGFSQLNAGVPPELRGTYAGLAHDASVAHLKRLGVTALSLLPVHQHLDEQRLVGMGLVNYWGYNTLGFFAPEPRYAAAKTAQGVRDEFRHMVRTLHAQGIEVILDVVYNHSCEGDQHGPTLSWRGLDNASWYSLPHDHADRYVNHTGCGNTLAVHHPRVLQFVMDSLRFWVQDMHVDGFRFDLAPVLSRGEHGFERQGAFFKAVAQDPVLAGTKMIAEPWDIGPGGYQLGGFPRGWLEWNDRFRDTLRGWWLQGPAGRGDFAQRLCASADVFHWQHRLPVESVNYVVSHDGFTLRDLVSYNQRHNLANGEDNRDGHGHNLSHNCGAEGPSAHPEVQDRRARLQRALLASLLLSQGTPMLAAGDELGHSQRGNNNPYCQDNQLTWIDWSEADAALLAFTERVLRLRREHLPLGPQWYSGLSDARGVHDLAWLNPDGSPLQGDAWHGGHSRCLGALIGRPGRCPPGHSGSLLMLVNAQSIDCEFRLPAGAWLMLLDSQQPDGAPALLGPLRQASALGRHSLQLLKAV